MEYRILIVDDEAEIRELMRLYLEKDGYDILEAANGLEALEIIKKEPEISLILLDIMMPQMDGLQVLRKLRPECRVPIVIMSAKTADNDKILGLDMGADDYITKPFNPLEAVARINSNIRRFYSIGSADSIESNVTTKQGESVLKVGSLRLDLDSCILYRREEEIVLSSVEFHLMKLFMEYPGKIFTKQQLYECGWGEEYLVSDNNIMVCISKLRSKLDQGETSYIKTMRGLGYRLETLE